jgi:hypothetical protein
MAVLCLFAKFGNFRLSCKKVRARDYRVPVKHRGRAVPRELASDYLWDASRQKPPRTRSAEIVE